MEWAIETDDLTKSFRRRVKEPGLKAAVKDLFAPQWQSTNAVKKLSIRIPRGEMLAFIGPNGAGKSTTIKMLSGILHPDSGTVQVLGLNPHKDRRKLAYRIGTVFGQKSQLWFHLPPADTFRLLGAIYDIEPTVLDRRIGFLSEAFELADLLTVPTRKLSLGQRIRCEIAASLVHEPDILFLDEPSIGLDVVAKKKLRSLIKRINEESGVTVFLTSHDAGDIESLGRQALVISEGSIIWQGSVKELKYSLLTTRIVDVKLDTPGATVPDIPGVSLLKGKEWSMKLEVDLNTANLPSVIADITARNMVADIAVNPTPMEEVIERVYSGDLGGGT